MDASKSFSRRYGALFRSADKRNNKGSERNKRTDVIDSFEDKRPVGDCCVVKEQGIRMEQDIRMEHDIRKEQSRVVNIVDDDSRLRDYQQLAVKKILNTWKIGHRNVMLQMPTGTGKTRLFVALISALNETGAEAFAMKSNPRFLIVTHREELVEQISDTLISHYHLEHRILGKDKTVTLDYGSFKQTGRKDNICVSSIQYLSRQLKNNASALHDQRFDFIIIDEAHHSLAESYVLLWRSYPDAFKLGVTATPYRLKGQGFTELYDKLIESLKVSDFIEQGYLADYRFLTVSCTQAALQKVNRLTKVNVAGDYQTKDLQEIYANSEEIAFLYDCYKEYADGMKGIIYAVNQIHAEMIAGYFAEHGVSIANIDSKTAKGRRKELISKFRNGELQILVNVELFGEGFDCPSIEFAMLARPTKSLAMYLQQVGRALRPTGNGNKVLILDCVGLYNRFGLPEHERNWMYFFAREKKARGEFAKPLGINSDSEGMVEIFTPREVEAKAELLSKKRAELEVFCTADGNCGIRNKLGTVIVKPQYKELSKTDDGWFYGKDMNGLTVIFNCDGAMVLHKKNCDVVLRADKRFMLSLTSADGAVFELGPYDKRMCIEPKYLKTFELCCNSEWPYRYLTMYYQRDNYIAMNTYKLSLDTMFFRKTAQMRRGTVFLDLDMNSYALTNDGRILMARLPDDEKKKVMRVSAVWGKKGIAIMGRD